MDAVIIEPQQPAQVCVIWLHGLGADGHDFEPIVPELGLNATPTRFIFPHAPIRPITINGGVAMRGWYDILSIEELKRDVDVVGIRESLNTVNNIIKQQIEQGIASDKIFIAGFSQGGVIAAYTALLSEYTFAGVLALSTYLPAWDDFSSEVSKANTDTPIFVGHGTHDPIVPMQAGEMLYQQLQTLGMPTTWHTYAMPHSVCTEEIIDIRHFIKAQLS